MVDRNIVEKLGLSQEVLEKEVNDLFNEEHTELLNKALEKTIGTLVPGTILPGRIVGRIGNDVIVELGLKSEGVVSVDEFDEPSEIASGQNVEVLLEEVDAEGGGILLNKRKADRIRGWERVVENNVEGDIVTGKVTRRIKGGLLVDIGVPVFLPASQVDIRRPGDISRFIGKDIECQILKIDVENRNIVVSRRKIVEEQRRGSKEAILNDIEVGQLRKGIVKNIADFGVFVDLGGLDGLLHISDLSWGRISHPSEIVQLDQEVECLVIGVDKEHEKISLGLKQKAESPWETVEERYPIGGRIKGKIVNITNYGAFIRLEEGIEGLVHISEISWTKRVLHPADILNLGEEIEVEVLDVNKEKQEISLGIKQLETDPWTVAAQKYPPGTIVETKITSLTNYGAFVEIEPGVDGLVHISDLSWTKKFNHPSEVVRKSDMLKCLVLEVDEEKHRVSLGVKQMTEDPWARAIPEKYMPGQVVKGTVTKLTNFGVFVELEPDFEGLLHISEISDDKIDKPQDVVNMDDMIEVKILRVDSDSRKIGLSLRRVQWAANAEAEAEGTKKDTDDTTPEEKPVSRGGLDGPLISASDVIVDPDETAEQKETAVKEEITIDTDQQKAEEKQQDEEEIKEPDDEQAKEASSD